MPSHTAVLAGSRGGRSTEIEVWRGASGTLYPYTIVEIGQHPNAEYGNYIFAKRDRSGKWVAIFVGHGDLELRTDLDQHALREVIRRMGATHVHIHENPSLPDRMIERSDVLGAHPEACYSSHYRTNVPA
jgi:hypothetical protein